MSIQKPGRNSVKAISISAADSHIRERTRNTPCAPAVKTRIAACRHDEDDHPFHEGDVDQQQIGVEDEQERQQRGAQRIEERHETGADRVAARHGRRRKGGEPHRRRHIRHDAEVEHEQMHRDQRHDQPVLLAERTITGASSEDTTM
jgi:hypothetical protein